MIRNYFKVTYRNLIRQKAFAFINIFGLAIGLACSILIGLYVKHELSYDKFFKDANRLYRVTLDFKLGGNTLKGPLSPAPLAFEIRKQIPETDDVLRMNRQYNMAVHTDNKVFYEDRFYFVDSNFFNFFGIKLIDGNPKTVLANPNSLVITKQLSYKYFGIENSIGKILPVVDDDDTINYEITGIVEELPENCHFHFDLLASMSSHPDSKIPFWLGNNYYTYLKLKKATNIKDYTGKIWQIFRLNATPQLNQYFNMNLDDFVKAGNHANYELQPVKSVHLHSNLNYELEENGSMVYVSIFILVAIFILLNACINFTNLATARSATRAKEVGLRKVLGSEKKNLIIQFLSEAIVVTYLAVLLAILMVELLLPSFNNLLNVNLQLTLLDYLKMFPLLLLFATIVGIIAGSYPAFFMSAFKLNDVLKNKILRGNSRNWLRDILVVFQFSISIIIMLCTMLVSSQLNYFQHKKLGFDKSKLLVVERTNPLNNQIKVFVEELKKNPAIEKVCLSTGIPGRPSGDQGYMLEGRGTTETFVIDTYGIGYDYLETMGINLKEGRSFSRDFATDSVSVIINESCVKYLGLTNPVGKQLLLPSNVKGVRKTLNIIGVIKDFHYESLHKEVNPLLLFLTSDYFNGYVNIRMMEGKEKDVKEFVNITWKNLVSDFPMQYFYFDDQFNTMYKKEIETQHLMDAFSILTILIASLGLFGLIAFMAERRTKEIGVRKVLGSSVWGIVKILTKEVSILVIVSFIIASPLAWWWMHSWLTNFAYRTPIHLWIFVLGFVVALVIAWLTVSTLAMKAALRNPVDALKYE